MKIIYVANFEAGGAEDENAILHALRELGHEVWPVREDRGHAAEGIMGRAPDLLLFHKWCNPSTLHRFRGVCPRAFWWFDLVDFPGDPTLERRNAQRRHWMAEVVPNVEFGFLSDGDWVARDATGKLRVLYQGADERLVGRGEPCCPLCRSPAAPFDLLLTAIGKGGGTARESFIREMRERYGDRLHHCTEGLYRERLRTAVAAAKIVVCPDSPVTDLYWSNRVWNMTGFGGFVLHPYCAALERDGFTRDEVIYYSSRDHLHELINHYLGAGRTGDRAAVAGAALARVRRDHLYRHRVEKLIRTVEGKT